MERLFIITRKYIAGIGLLYILFYCYSCNDFVEVDLPSDKVSVPIVFADSASTVMYMDGLEFLATRDLLGIYSLLVINGAGDEFNSTSWAQYITPTYASDNSHIANFWSGGYALIRHANLALENLPKTTLSKPVQNKYMAKAYFYRALSYFYLTNSFGGVPYVTVTDPEKIRGLGRISKAEVYKNILADLLLAKNLFENPGADTNATYISSRLQVQAFLSRMYLYNKDWENAEAEASAVISSGKYEVETDLTKVFKRGNREIIFALASSDTYNPDLASWRTYLNSSTVYLNSNFLSEFEAGDKRKTSWVKRVNSTISTVNKYSTQTSVPEDNVIIRLSEIYLIRAEARTQLGKYDLAKDDINYVRTRHGGLENTAEASTPAGLMVAIEHERLCELFGEEHRWFDLKRWDLIDIRYTDAAHTSLKSGWKSYKALLPIPNAQVSINNNVIQNPGYTK